METFKFQDTEWRKSSAQWLDNRKAKGNRKWYFFQLADFSTEQALLSIKNVFLLNLQMAFSVVWNFKKRNCVLNAKTWWIFKEKRGFYPNYSRLPTKQHHVFAQIKQNLHEMSLAHAVLYPARLKSGVCWIVMFSPHQKMLRSLCIKSGGMLLRW